MMRTASPLWWPLAALVAVMTLVLSACGGSEPAGSDDVASASADPAAVSLADLMSAPVPSLCDHEPGNLVNGRLPLLNPMFGQVMIAQTGDDSSPVVAFGDLTGDGVNDGALVTTCSAGGVAWPATVQLYTKNRRHLGGIDLGDVTHGREFVQKISVGDGVVHVDWLTNGPDDAACCPSVQMSGDMRWDGTRVVMENVRETGRDSNRTSVSAALYERDGNYYFISPSGKFHCGILAAAAAPDNTPAAGCHGTTQPVPPRPASCSSNISWGRGMQVDAAGTVSFICTGGVIFGPGSGSEPPALDYGQPLSVHGFTCSTETTGVTCKQESSGHGFTIADNKNSTF